MTTTAPQPAKVTEDHGQMLLAIWQISQRLESRVNNCESGILKLVAASSTAHTAKPKETKARAPKAAKFPASAKIWFKKIYMETEAERAKYVPYISAVKGTTKWTSATAEERLRIEADAIFKFLGESALPEDQAKMAAIKAAYDAALAQEKAKLGIEPTPLSAIAATTPSATVAIPAAAATAPIEPAKKPRVRKAAPKKAAAQPVANAIPPPQDDGGSDDD